MILDFENWIQSKNWFYKFGFQKIGFSLRKSVL